MSLRPQVLFRPPTPPRHPKNPSNFDPTPMLVPTPVQQQPLVPIPPPPPHTQPTPNAASYNFDPFSPQPNHQPVQAQPSGIQVSSVTEAEQRTSTVISDLSTGSHQVIQQKKQSVTLNNSFQVDPQGHTLRPSSAFNAQTNVSYPAQYYLPQYNPNVPPPQMPPPSAELAVPGAWHEDSARLADANLAQAQHQAPPPPPPSTDQEMSGVEEETRGQQLVATGAGEPAPAATRQLVHVPVGVRPPPERDPSDDRYQYLGNEQKDLDLNAIKIWKQEERLRDFEAIFGTHDPNGDPTNATEEFFTRSGYRRGVSANHIMVALRNSNFSGTMDSLLETARRECPEQDGARLLLLECAIENLMTPKMQKQKGLRSAKGKRRTPDEAAAALKIRAEQEALTAARRANKDKAKDKDQPKPSTSGQKPSSTSNRPLTRQQSGTQSRAPEPVAEPRGRSGRDQP